ncbi:MAG: hypothetical protein ACK4GU_13500 [Alishewanella aestuarii]
MANPNQSISQLCLLAQKNCTKAEALAHQAAKVAQMNPLSAATQIRALVNDFAALLASMAVEQAATVAAIQDLKTNLSGLLPKGEN